ncbi:MAG: 3-methyl-2-oxobutanoate hydroxymethyltransferase [Rhodospirillaceae bacterium]|jgi:3-methyl-2-oxobutanoate hydroxymethyltransferase|nr:3-methyl-2-oxobutanoate hydroxymethyltransferase [Rhodospirillaceae bacterium]MBT6119601.1 3-methyl-2-oxobutanoate hydroxymethyltransferase [Rhodospirillaceae bacterium]
MPKGRPKRMTVPRLRAAKGGVPLVCLTAYTSPMARLLDPLVDLLLVGDSVGMVIYGMPDTVGVDLETMIRHGRAVAGAADHALVVVDLPFGSYEASPEQAFGSAARVLAETGAAAVKLEGGQAMAETIAFLSARGVPVIGHIGMTPQAVNMLGGFGARGRSPEEARRIAADADAVAEAGAVAIVVEGTVETLAEEITGRVAVPTIGIGASSRCDGQILVTDDLLGLFPDFTPPFVRQYAELAGTVRSAVSAYGEDVRARRFPGPEHVYAAGDGKA